MFKKLKDKKGFTLVELIVVLVILAILAALLVPALTGYIDKANKEKVIAECRMAVMAAQTEATTIYGEKGKVDDDTFAGKDADIRKLAEVSGHWQITYTSAGKITSLKYSNENWYVEYTAADGDKAATYTEPQQIGASGVTVSKIAADKYGAKEVAAAAGTGSTTSE